MDEAFMSRIAERIAAATEAVSSFSPTADPGKLPAAQTVDEWMASHSPDARHRCVDCKAPLVEGSANICVACGRPLPPRLAVRREEFTFDKSLAKRRFYESVHLEDCQDTSSDTTELQEASSSGMETIANGHSQQQSPWTSGIEVGTVERNLQGGERGKTNVSNAGDNIIPAPAESLSNPLKEAAEEDEYIWGSADVDDFGSRAWTQQLARGSGGDSKEISIADNSPINSATKILGQTLSTDENEFSFAVASSSADQSVAPSVEIDFDFFPPGGNSVYETRGEEGETAGPSTSKESLGQSIGPYFHDFFQVSPPVAGEKSEDPKVHSPDPFLLVGSTGQTVKENFDDFFQVSPDSTDQSHRHNEETAVPYSAEESRSYNIETDFDDFFQGLPKSVDHSHGLNGETSVPHTAEESSSPIIGTDFDGFFNGDPGSADLSRGPNVKTMIPHAEEESNARDGEADFDDFFEAAPRSGDGSKDEMTVPHVTEAFSVHREEPYFDFFFETSVQSVNQSRGQNVETAIPHLPEKSSGLNVETDFDFFFQPGPVLVDRSSSTPKVQSGAVLPAIKSIGQKSDNQFADFFQVTVKSADEDHAQNGEMLFPVSAESAKVAIPVPLTGEDDQDGEADFDDFFQAAPVPAGAFPAQNKDEAGHNSIEGLVRQAIKTDFDSFFQASPNSAKGSGGHNTGTDFDYFFQTPIKSEDRGQDPHAQPGVRNIQAESKGQIMEPDFDEFFQAANDSINHSQGQKVKTVATNLVEESVGQNGETQFEDFFKAAPHSIGQSNGNNKEAHFDFFQATPFHGKESSGQHASTGSHGFFAGVPHAAEKSLGESERSDFDPFFQVSPWSMDKSLDQNGTTDLSDADFDDFVQAAPQSADQVVASSQKTEVDSFQATPQLVDKSQQSSTEDFDDFFQAAPQTADKTPDVKTKTEFDFLKASPQSPDKSRYKPESADFSDLFQVAPARTEVPKLPSTPSGLFVLGNGSGQIAGASLTSPLTEGRSNNGETPKQLEGRHSPQSPLQGHLEPPTNIPNVLSDLSFRLADQLVIADEAATNMWSFN